MHPERDWLGRGSYLLNPYMGLHTWWFGWYFFLFKIQSDNKNKQLQKYCKPLPTIWSGSLLEYEHCFATLMLVSFGWSSTTDFRCGTGIVGWRVESLHSAWMVSLKATVLWMLWGLSWIDRIWCHSWCFKGGWSFRSYNEVDIMVASVSIWRVKLNS